MTSPPRHPAAGLDAACPSLDLIERGVASGNIDDSLRTHLASCAACREAEQLVRDNMKFMRGLLDELGPAAEPVALDPDALPGYRLVREIARGGQGVVYEAIQIDTKRRVAVKMLQPGAGRSLHGLKRIEREAEISAGLRHPNIVTVYASTPLPGGRYALAMEYVDGIALDEWAKAVDSQDYPDRTTQREAVRHKLKTFAAVCDAVQYAHQNGIIHRDLKPANILVPDDGVPRVLDFGIARRTTPEPGITMAGQFAGTLAYASPEQVSGDPDLVDTRSDIYSLGVILYQVLTGRRPYDTERSLTGAITNITKSDPEPMRHVQPGNQPAGDELGTIVIKALAKDSAGRYQTAGELKADIENFLAGRAVTAKRESTLYVLRKAAARHRPAFTAAAAFLIMLVAFAVSMAWSARRLDRQRGLLAESLTLSTIERGRLLGVNGSNARAEALLWPELLRTRADPTDPGLGFTSPPEATQAAWALFELASRHSNITAVPVPKDSAIATFNGDRPEVRVTGSDGAEQLISIPSGRLIRSDPAIRKLLGQWPLFSDAGTFLFSFKGDVVRAVDLLARTAEDLSHPELAGTLDMDISRDGSRMVTIGAGSVVRLWKTHPLAPIARLAENMTLSTRPLFTVDGLTVSAGVDQEVRLWDAADGRPMGAWRIPDDLWTASVRRGVRCAQASRDGKHLALVFGTRVLVYSRLDSTQAPVRLEPHRGFVANLSISEDSSTLISAGQELSCRTYDLTTNTLRSSFEVKERLLTRPALSHDGRLAALCDINSILRVWETSPRGWLTRLEGFKNSASAVRFSPDGRLVTAVSADGSVSAWSTSDRKPAWSIAGQGSLLSVNYSPDGHTVAFGSEDGTVRLCDAMSGGPPLATILGPQYITWVGYSPDGRTLAITGSDAKVHLHDARSGAETGVLSGHRTRVVEAVFLPDSSRMATAGSDGLVIIWNLTTRLPIHTFNDHHAAVRAITLSPDGSRVASGGDDRAIRIWDVSSGRCMTTIRDVKQHVFGLAWHPSGNILFSCCRDSVLQVWDTRTGRELAVMEGHTGVVLGMSLSPDGRTLATASADHTVGLWDLAYYQTHVKGCAPAWRSGSPERSGSDAMSASAPPVSDPLLPDASSDDSPR